MTYQSESDYPIDEVTWITKPGVPIVDIARAHGYTKKSTQVLNPDIFAITQSDATIKLAVDKLKGTTQELTLFKTPRGSGVFDLLLIGKVSETEVIGLHTKSVET